MRNEARAPAERHPIEPPDLRRHGEIDEEQQQHHRHIGEEVDGEASRAFVDEDALAPVRLAQQQRQRMRGDRDAPAHQHPGEPERARGEPEIDRGADERAGDVGHEVAEEDAHRQILNIGSHASPLAVCAPRACRAPRARARRESHGWLENVRDVLRITLREAGLTRVAGSHCRSEGIERARRMYRVGLLLASALRPSGRLRAATGAPGAQRDRLALRPKRRVSLPATSGQGSYGFAIAARIGRGHRREHCARRRGFA